LPVVDVVGGEIEREREGERERKGEKDLASHAKSVIPKPSSHQPQRGVQNIKLHLGQRGVARPGLT